MSIEYPGQRWVLKLLHFKFNFKTILVYQVGFPTGIPLRRIACKDFFLLCHSLNIARRIANKKQLNIRRIVCNGIAFPSKN